MGKRQRPHKVESRLLCDEGEAREKAPAAAHRARDFDAIASSSPECRLAGVLHSL